MPLTVYRRHSAACKFRGRPRHDARSQRCHCILWVQGSLGPDYVRASLNQTVWEAAQTLVRGWEGVGRISWAVADSAPTTLPPAAALADMAPTSALAHEDLQAPTSPPSVLKEGGPEEIPAILGAIERFFASLRTQNLSWETLRKYESFLLRRLQPWCAKKGYVVGAQRRLTISAR